MKEYRKTATVKAKLFEPGDEDGFTWTYRELASARDDDHFGITRPEPTIPYVSTLENQEFKGEFGKHYICTGIKGERWLVEKEIFETTYTEI